MVGPEGFILGGIGDDTINAWGGGVVVPGPGTDVVSVSQGATVKVLDLCEAPAGETLYGGGDGTLVTPVPLDELRDRGLSVNGFSSVLVEQASCESSCVTKPDCSGHGTCAEGANPGEVRCACDTGWFGPDCSKSELEFSFPLPSFLNSRGVVLAASESLKLGDGVVIQSDDVPTAATHVIGMGTGGVTIGAGSRVGSALSASKLSVGAGAVLSGYAAAESLTLHPDAQVFGEIRNPFNFDVDLHTFRMKPSIGDARAVAEVGHTLQLAPGGYREVVARTGSTLVIGSGQYAIEALRVEAGATLILDALSDAAHVLVTSLLKIDGQVVRQGLRNVVWLYSGLADLHLHAFAGTLVAPLARVRLASSPMEVRVFAKEIGVDADTVLREPLPFPLGDGVVKLPRGTSPFVAPETDAEVPEPGPSVWRTYRDNPWFSGSFEMLDGESASGFGTYSTGFSWDNISEPILHLEEHWSPLNLAVPAFDVWRAPLLPAKGIQTGPGTASWATRSGNIVPGNLYRASRSLVHSGVEPPVSLGPTSSIWVGLDNYAIVVPVVLVSWISHELPPTEDEIRKHAELRALFDFIPFEGERLSTRVDGVDLQDPEVHEVPPDDIWLKCGIQFQVVRDFIFERPKAPTGVYYRPRDCALNNVGERMFAHDADFEGKVEERIGVAEAAKLYGPGVDALDPITMQYGPFPCTSRFKGKADVGAKLAQCGSNINTFKVCAAHEMGHILVGPDRIGEPPALMAEQVLARSDTEITPMQCETARAAARKFAQRYDKFLLDGGRSGIPSIDDIGSTFRIPATEARPTPQACCQISGEPQWTSWVGCFIGDGEVLETEACNVCCRTSDPIELDAPDAPLSLAVKLECSAERSMDVAQCDTICCDFGDETKTTSRYECEASNPERGYFPGVVVDGNECKLRCDPDGNCPGNLQCNNDGFCIPPIK